MKFSEQNIKTDDYLQHFKAFQLSCVAVSAGGFADGFSDRFLGLIDGGAKNTCISSKRMKTILRKVKGNNGKELQPIGTIKIKGVVGHEQDALVYRVPHFYLGKIHFEDLIVTVPESNNFDCLIGRSILHQCISTYDPLADMIHFDFDPRLQHTRYTPI